jgi:preprotein translocase SecE subunit
VARNRKRAKDRRPRRPPQAVDPRQGVPTATHDFDNGLDADRAEVEENGVEVRDNGAPDPIEHATPDVELAEEQLAYGRPDEVEPEDEADEEEFELEVEESIASGGGGRGGRGRRGGDELNGGSAGSGDHAHSAALTERRSVPGSRLIEFLQGSWRELQRVQWPDRRQVMQATGVVIGFVIVAAAFLGVADEVAGKLVSFVLK